MMSWTLKTPVAFGLVGFLAVLAPALVSGGQGPEGAEVPTAVAMSGSPSRQAYLDCTGLAGYAQPLADYNHAWTSDLGWNYAATEDTVDAAGTIVPLGAGSIDQMRWWGISWEWDSVSQQWLDYCPEDDDAGTAFVAVFFADGGRVPGCVLAARVFAAQMEDTGLPWGGAVTVREYTASFDEVDATQVSWVLVARLEGEDAASGNPCLFLRVAEAVAGTYDDMSYQFGSSSPIKDQDLTMCLNLSPPSGSYPEVFQDGFLDGTADCWSAVQP